MKRFLYKLKHGIAGFFENLQQYKCVELYNINLKDFLKSAAVQALHLSKA